jgi:PTS system nitrogen regulatory IIA component
MPQVTKKQIVDLSAHLSLDLIVHCTLHSRDEVISYLIALADKHHKITDKKAFQKAVFEREAIVSTGIGLEVAIPHAKLTNQDQFFIATAVLGQGVEWDSLDKLPVRIVFLIGGPQDSQTEYLKILSSLTLAIKDEEKRKKILSSKTPTDVYKLFEQS